MGEKKKKEETNWIIVVVLIVVVLLIMAVFAYFFLIRKPRARGPPLPRRLSVNSDIEVPGERIRSPRKRRRRKRRRRRDKDTPMGAKWMEDANLPREGGG